MKKTALLCLTVIMMVWPLAASAEQNGRDERAKSFTDAYFNAQKVKYAEAMETAAPAAGEGPGGIVFLFIPEFHYSQHGDLSTTLSGTDLISSGGDAYSADFLLLAQKPISDLLTLGVTYQFTHLSYSGGLLVPAGGVPAGGIDYFSGDSDIDVTSNLIGLDALLNFQAKGRLSLGLAQAWDIYNGNETFRTHFADGTVAADRRSADAFKTRVTSLMAWYDVDVALNESWTLNPYLGWRSIYAVVSNQNLFAEPAGQPGSMTENDGSWAHLATLGLKLKYQADLFGFYVRGGLNHRVSSDDVPGFGSRAMAPGVVHLGYMVNFDRTVGSWGAGFNYVIPETCVIDFGYNGYAGSDLDAHTATMTLVFPF
ncbi:MAG: autotransporter outer membrane beta-barrel domain-containing protein [Candidatus Adiutrix sp.]|jgi:hypothetical protein|nr:autotransporter outer membrane beta-barrel domain-containing protein [Candidatus Adiutrix sp.]